MTKFEEEISTWSKERVVDELARQLIRNNILLTKLRAYDLILEDTYLTVHCSRGPLPYLDDMKSDENKILDEAWANKNERWSLE